VDESERRADAKRRIKRKRDFQRQAVTLAAVSVLLIIIWAATGQGYFWPAFPIAAFALALAVNAWHVYGDKPISEDEIQREMQRGG
jgi:ABC-type phosphate transport system auxiliary subunit